jgi:RNA polymerase sigma-70 factor (ECF subfamily)
MDRSPCARSGLEPPLSEDLILRGAGGDRRALAELIARYRARVAGFVIAQTGDANNYEDLCQSIFVKMVLALPRLRATDRFESWLFQIARNACRDHLRARQGWRKLFVPLDPVHEHAPANDLPAGSEHEAGLEQGMARLPADQRDLLQQSLREKRSYEELARMSNSSVSAVKSRLFRARENLRGLLLAGGHDAERK